MSKKKKFVQVENVQITDTSSDGRAIARINDLVTFIKGAVPGDVVTLEITKKKQSYIEANLIRVEEPSPKRVEPFCSHFGVCGGCKWQNMQYEHQLFYKQKQVVDAFKRIGKLDMEPQPILGSEQNRYYRNKLNYTFSVDQWLTYEQMDQFPERKGQPALGFHIQNFFNKVVQVDTCYLQDDLTNQIRREVHRFANLNKMSYYDHVKHTGLLRELIVRNTSLGQWMLIVVFAEEDVDNRILLLDHLYQTFPQLDSLVYTINSKFNDSLHDQESLVYKGADHILEKLENLHFKISPKSFFQTNTQQALQLYKITRDYAGLTGNETVYDLYTGTGSIALFVAQQAKKVIGIEYVEEAIVDARANAELNKIDNCAFFAGDMKDILSEEFILQHGTPDVIITDPPRAGMHPDVVKTILKVLPQRIVYVSCNPATQARDLALMNDHYKLLRYQPVDMFPHTNHVENVALLDRI